MFPGLGKITSLLTQLPKLRSEMEKLQQRLAQLVAAGAAGGGMVKVRANGKMEILACTSSDELLRLNDREMLEDLIRAATNQALQKVRELTAEETSKMAAGMGLPAGVGLPGMQE